MIPFPPKHILVPFDFSAASAAALETARRWSERFGARVEVFYVDGRGGAERQSVLRKLARAAGPRATLHVAEGEAAPAIVRHARFSGADLLIMGTKGRVGLKRLREGSVTESVVRESPIPVLSVHESAAEVASVLAPMNLEPYAEAGLLAACQTACELGATVTALHVEPRRDDAAAARARHAVQTLVESLPEPLRSRAAPRVRIESGEPVETILSAAPAYGLVVLVARRKSVVGDALLGTTAEQVLRRSPSPVLAIPCPTEPAGAPELAPVPWLAPLPPFA